MPKINHEEYEVLKELDDKWRWIARDDENQEYSAEIYVFGGKPERENGYWDNVIAHDYALLEEWDDLFQFIQWEDEPYKIAELIEEYERESHIKQVLEFYEEGFRNVREAFTKLGKAFSEESEENAE